MIRTILWIVAFLVIFWLLLLYVGNRRIRVILGSPEPPAVMMAEPVDRPPLDTTEEGDPNFWQTKHRDPFKRIR